MNWSFVRHELGAISFVVAVIVGIIAVPLALLLHNPSSTGAANVGPTSVASAPRTSSPSASASPK
ncbi:MAG: hypothetical protein WAM30_00715 [Candidatus Dormiibacterota bacterium]